MTIKHVLITGAAGAIGTVLRAGLAGSFQLRSSDIQPIADPLRGEETAIVDIADLDAMEAAAKGMDAIVHLGAIASEDDFAKLLAPNFVAVYNAFEAAYRKGVKRIIFASSNHAIGLYPVERRIGIDEPHRPDSFYGIGKAFGENLAQLYWAKWGVEAVNLRIGSFLPRPTEVRHLSTWLSHGDLVRLVHACLTAPVTECSTVYGISANTRSWWDNPDAARIGFRPADNAEDYAEEILAATPNLDPHDPAIRFQGGFIAAIDYGKRQDKT